MHPVFQRLARITAASVLAVSALTGQGIAPAHADDISQLQQQLAQDQAQLAQLQSQIAGNTARLSTLEVTLGQLRALVADLGKREVATQISLDDNQATLTKLQGEEADANRRLGEAEAKLKERQAAFDSHVRTLDKIEQAPVLEVILTSGNFNQFFERVTSVVQIIANDRELADQLKHDRDQVQQVRDLLAQKRAQQQTVVATIAAQKQSLDQEYALQLQAQSAVSATESQIRRQQQQLSQQSNDVNDRITVDQSEIEALIAFTQGRIGTGGAVVSPEFLSNGWGQYYNQRDARWGNDYVGSSAYEVWEIGCLLSDVAMVYTHFGSRSVTPATIALNPSNFTADGLMYNSVLNIPGHPATVNNSPTSSWIHSWLDSGGTVIVGMYISGGTHFVTLTASRGSSDYWMNDPWNVRAMNVSFNSSDVTGPIFEAIGYR